MAHLNRTDSKPWCLFCQAGRGPHCQRIRAHTWWIKHAAWAVLPRWR